MILIEKLALETTAETGEFLDHLSRARLRLRPKPDRLEMAREPFVPPRVASLLTASARSMIAAATAFARTLWRLVRALLLGALNLLLALILMFEEWGWRPLSALLASLARFPFWARTELWIAGLPPYGALAVFAFPPAILFPVKIIALYLLALGHALTAAVLIIGAKIASTALIARIFILTKPALMQISWFAWAYNTFVPWQEELFAKVRSSWAWRYGRMVKRWVKHEIMQFWTSIRPRILATWRRLRQWLIATWQRVRAEARDAVLRARLGVTRAWRRMTRA